MFQGACHLEGPPLGFHPPFPTPWFPTCLFTQMKKGNTMQQFLQKALEILRKDFSELRWGCVGM